MISACPHAHPSFLVLKRSMQFHAFTTPIHALCSLTSNGMLSGLMFLCHSAIIENRSIQIFARGVAPRISRSLSLSRIGPANYIFSHIPLRLNICYRCPFACNSGNSLCFQLSLSYKLPRILPASQVLSHFSFSLTPYIFVVRGSSWLVYHIHPLDTRNG